MLTTFENGTSKVTWINGTDIQFINGIGVLIGDPNAANYSPQPISAALVNTIIQQLSYVVKFTIERPNIELPPLPPNSTDPTDPDEVLPYCDLVDEDFTGSCHDRKDFDDVTGLYSCNDGTQ